MSFRGIRSGILSVILLQFGALAAEPKWIRMKTADFVIYSTGGEGSTRETLRQFERVRAFFDRLTGSQRKSGNPVRIVAFGSKKEYLPYRPNEFATAFYRNAGSDDYIVMSDTGLETAPLAVHEYVHLHVRHAGLRLPPWLNEGLAEVYSTLREIQGKVVVGTVPAGRLQALQRGQWVALATILAADHDSPYYNERDKAGSLYNEGWALTHMLALDEGYRPGFAKVVELIQGGLASPTALEKTYGKPLKKIEDDLKSYLLRPVFNGAQFDQKLLKDNGVLSAEAAPPLEVKLMLADLLNRPGREAESEARYQKLVDEFPGEPEPLVRLGYAELRGGRPVPAEQHLRAAFERGSRDVEMLSRLAYLEQSEPQKAEPVLERLLEQAPDRVEERLLLAGLQLQMKKPGRAIATLNPVKRVTEDVAPRYFQLFAYAALGLGDRAEAKKAAQRLLQSARDEAMRGSAMRLLASLDQPAAAEAVMLPSPEARPVLRRREEAGVDLAPPPMPEARGKFIDFQCLDAGPRMVVETPDGRKTFLFDRPDQTTILGGQAGKLELNCGRQPGLTVRLEYEPSQAPGLAGLVRLLEVLK